jgi:hypothetical protein
MPQSAKKSRDNDKSSAVISRSAATRQVRELLTNQGCPSLLQDPPDTSCTSDCVGGVRWCLGRPACHHRANCQFCIIVWLLAKGAPFHQREQPRATPTFGNVIVDALLLCWRLIAIARGCRPRAINFFIKKLTQS